MWGLQIANHMDQSLWSTNQKYWAAVRSNLLHSFWRCTSTLCLLPATTSCMNLVQKNQFFWAKRTHFDISPINFTTWSHILSTIEDALMLMPVPLSITGGEHWSHWLYPQIGWQWTCAPWRMDGKQETVFCWVRVP